MSDLIKQIFRQHSSPLEPLPTGETAVLNRLAGIRAVLFDIYGTMFISASGEVGTVDTGEHAAAFEEALRAAGIELNCCGADGVEKLHAGIKESHAESRDNGIEYPEIDIIQVWDRVLKSLAAETGTSGDDIDPAAIEQLAIEYEVRTNPAWPMPGLKDCLTAFQNQGLSLGIISNAQCFTPCLFSALLDTDVGEAGFHPQLQFYSYRYGQAKPGRFLYESAANELTKLGIEPDATLFVGNDMLNDITAAAGVGFRTALFAGDARSLRWRQGDERVAGVTPDVVVTHLDQLPNLIGS